MTRLAAGCMTGTSIDSIDAALVRIEGTGLEMRAGFVRGVSRPLGELASRLRKLADQEAMTAGEIATLSREFSLAHVPALKELISGEKVDLIAVHGQTVFHKPPVSWQMLTPAVIAREIGVPVVFDMRAADLAAGGQGAPITPIADWVLYAKEEKHQGDVTIVNLGGFCNISSLPGQDETEDRDLPNAERVALVEARDVCACNQLLDGIARARLGTPFDEDGGHAMRGIFRDAIVDDFRAMLLRQAASGRSLGTGDEMTAMIQRHGGARTEDVLRAACEAVASVVCEFATGNVILAGGGTRNAALLRAFRERNRRVRTSDEVGIPSSFREAACFGVLGALCQDRVPITLPQVTGVTGPAPVAGAWVYP